MKKIIFVVNNLETGGVQNSLLNLLKEIHTFYDITLLTFFGNDEFEKKLPSDVRLIKTKSSFRQLGMSATHINNTMLYLERVFWVALTKLAGRSFAIKLMCLGKKRYTGYDVAFSYIHEGPQKNLYGGCNEFVLKMVEAKKKVGWLHCDFNLSGANNSKSREIYNKFDTVVACSEGCRRAFVNCLPGLEEKTVSVSNCNDYERIKLLSEEAFENYKDGFNIVTVARLSEEKGIERAIEAVYHCVQKGYDVMYHIVGGGDREESLKALVTKLSLENNVFFYGNKQNPYPYIKNASLFLLPSYHEAAPIVFDEAAFLGVPVLATKTTSTDEMLLENQSGVVCENSQEGITQGLLKILVAPEQLNDISQHLKKRKFTNKESVNSVEAIINAIKG